MMTRIIALDLDGTLLDDRRQIHPRSAEAIQRAFAAGIELVFASGRMAASIACFIDELKVRAHIVSCNGAYVVAADGSEVVHAPVKRSHADPIIRYAQDRDLHLNVYSRQQIFMSDLGRWGQLYASRLQNVAAEVRSPEVLKSVSATKIMIVDDPDSQHIHREQLLKVFGADSPAIVHSEPEYLEFLSSGVNKATGLELLCAHLGISSSEAAAIGDYDNDVEMLRWAGRSAAVANGSGAAIAAADCVVASNLEGGPADFINSIV